MPPEGVPDLLVELNCWRIVADLKIKQVYLYVLEKNKNNQPTLQKLC